MYLIPGDFKKKFLVGGSLPFLNVYSSVILYRSFLTFMFIKFLCYPSFYGRKNIEINISCYSKMTFTFC